LSKGMIEKLKLLPIYILIGFIAFTCVTPFITIIATSFSGHSAILTGKVGLWPVDFHINAYKAVLMDAKFYRSLMVTIFVTVIGTLLNLCLTALTAYPLSKNIKGRKYIMTFIVFTMLFSGGLIPNYFNVRQLGLLDTVWALILPSGISTFNLIILRTFFMGIPKELEDAAFMDGAGQARILWKVYVPLSKTVLLTLGLFYAVAHWNSYMNAMIYIRNSELYTLQVRLRQLVMGDMATQLTGSLSNEDQQVLVLESVKAAIVVVSTIPIIAVYPWLQKYFVKGVMIGALKG